MDEAVESLMARSVIIHKRYETDISTAQFLKFSSGSVTEQAHARITVIHIDAIIAPVISRTVREISSCAMSFLERKLNLMAGSLDMCYNFS